MVDLLESALMRLLTEPEVNLTGEPDVDGGSDLIESVITVLILLIAIILLIVIIVIICNKSINWGLWVIIDRGVMDLVFDFLMLNCNVYGII